MILKGNIVSTFSADYTLIPTKPNPDPMKSIILSVLGTLFFLTGSSQIQIQGSYLNVSRPSGGPVMTGDILEMRAVISVPSGTTITSLYFQDAVPAGTSFVFGSLKTVTNEGVVDPAIPNTGNYTDKSGDDRGVQSGGVIVIYMGDNATISLGGKVVGGTTTPVFYSNATIMMAAYQVKVTAAIGSTITTAGAFHYNNNTTANLPANHIVVSNAYSCSSQDPTNTISAESGGTFGSGTSLNRSASSSVTGYTYTAIGANSPVDGDYSVVKNTSYNSYSGSSPSSSNKVFGVWDVIGDHTGTSNGTGNPPPASGTSSGYMLAINATFAPATVFTISANSLLPNSTYTVSLWVRNICPQCSANAATGGSGTTPGVSPNLAININGNNYYSTGNIGYTGQWVQKSFTFVNGSSTSATIDIKNNAPGGGGNDYVLDDISMKQCLVVLPLGLLSFSGRSTAQGILLGWQLSPWQGLHSFTIERSTDGTRFLPVGYQQAYPDSGTYQYTDALLPSSGSTLYYRIRMDDNDGTSQYSNIVVLRTGDDYPDMLTTRLSPNPARTATTLAIWSAHGGSADITLWSPAGTMIQSRKTTISRGTTTVSLDIPARLPTGIYIVRTTTGTESAVSRLVVE